MLTVWEYNVVDKWGMPFTNDDLNGYGSEGWELITVIESYPTIQGTAENATRYYVFKREKPS